MIQLDGVTKRFDTIGGQVPALDGVNLDVREGEFVAIQGPSGCGKSTLLSLVGGLAVPTAGRVLVAGCEVSALSSAARARFRTEHVGFVFQLFHLLPYLNVLDNVLIAAPGRAQSGPRKEAARLLDRFGMSDRLSHVPGQLSVGQRQRVAMARALLNRPRLLLADEPTGNLDTDSAAALMAAMAEFQHGGGTILLATHDRQLAERADRVVRMAAGCVVTVGAC
jgi:ABC-type lipoprotein export system ATPase subunit